MGVTALWDSPSTNGKLAAAYSSQDLSGELWALDIHLGFQYRNVT